MKTFSGKLSGIMLLLGSLMAVLTMVLHPVGGDMQHIVKIKSVLIFSHGMAIACMPLIGFGLWGFSKLLTDGNRLTVLAFFIALWGLGTATIAGTINGLVLPQFASAYVNAKLDEEMLKAVLDYGRYFNKSLAYVFMSCITVAILIWSLIIIYQKHKFKWFGFYGLLIFLLGAFALLSKASMTGVGLFGAFVFGIASWLVLAGILLFKIQMPKNK